MAKGQDDKKSALEKLKDFNSRRNIPRHALRDIPFIGNTLAEILFPEDRTPDQKQVEKVIGNAIQEHPELETKIAEIIAIYSAGVDSVLAIGSGVVENVFYLNDGLRIGSKHLTERNNFCGGSAVNHAARLMSADVPVLPIVSIGQDPDGHRIQEFILKIAEETIGAQPFINFIEEPGFCCEGLTTSTSTILVSGDDRTIFTERLGGAEKFVEFAERRLIHAKRLEGTKISTLMIGHILSDGAAPIPGPTTINAISEFKGQAQIFANFGSSQLAPGVDQWKNHLIHLDLVQFSLSEVRTFFSKTEFSKLGEIISWFQDREVTVLITLDKLGAVASYKDGSDGLVFAWPYDMEIKDSTGAGDAFGAGVVFGLLQGKATNFGNFFEAMKTARIWAAFACKSQGGASNTPSRKELREFGQAILSKQIEAVQIRSKTESELLLKLLDKAYP